jgi:glycine cleavage system H protein
MMKEIDELNLPDDVLYSKDHEYVRSVDQKVIIGITDYAQDQMGDLVFMELPQVGDRFLAGEVFGTVESVKAVIEVYMPLAGEVIEVNNSLEDAPEKVNNSPYVEGWMIGVKPDNPDELDQLMSSDAYLEMLKGLD